MFRGRTGSLVKIIWHDGIGVSLYAKRLERGCFVWPSAGEGMVSLTNAQLSCLLEGINWRNPPTELTLPLHGPHAESCRKFMA